MGSRSKQKLLLRETKAEYTVSPLLAISNPQAHKLEELQSAGTFLASWTLE